VLSANYERDVCFIVLLMEVKTGPAPPIAPDAPGRV
jgi:hypothetical protein